MTNESRCGPVTQLVDTIDVEARQVAIDAESGTLYAGDGFTLMSVVDLSTNQVIETVEVANYSGDIAIDSDSRTVWITDYYEDTVSVVDMNTYRVIDIIAVAPGPREIAVDSKTGTVIVASSRMTNGSAGSVSFIDIATHEVTDAVSVGGSMAGSPDGIALDSEAGLLYVPASRRLFVFDSKTHAVVDYLFENHGPWTAVALDRPGSGVLYLTGSESLEIVDASARKGLSYLYPIGAETMDDIASAAECVYIASDDGTMITLDKSENRVIDIIEVGESYSPSDIDVDPATGLVYVCVGGDGVQIYGT